MKLNSKLLLIAAFFVLALPLIFAGVAGAMYMEDGARPNGTGGWKIPTDMVCVTGLHTDGTLDIAAGITNSRDCIYRNTGLTGMDPVDVTGSSICGTTNAGPFNLSCASSANCKFTSAAAAATWNSTDSKCYDSARCVVAGAPGNDGTKHALATSICLDGSGNGLSLAGLDRTAQMCAAKGGTWKQTSATAPNGFAGTFPTLGYGGSCVAYTRQFKGENATGAPLAFGAKGTTQGAGTGYCYTTMNMTTAYSTSATCPSNPANTSNASYDWAFSSGKCTYAKGMKGYPASILVKADGTTNPTTTNIDLRAYTTMGECLAQGASWSNWTGQAAAGTTAVGTTVGSLIPAWDYTKETPDADNGCIHCHSTTVEYNGPAEREKDSYVKTGHKNMLRKVSPGIQWAGANNVVYTTDGTNAINFMTGADPYGKITVSGTPQNLYYIYGDWMIPLPSVVYGTNGYGSAPGATNGYTCAACHTTGYSDVTGTAPGLQSIGTPGYAGVQPNATFAGINLGTANPKWDLDGIQCSRCHSAEVGFITAAKMAASSFPSTHFTTGGMGILPVGVGKTDICFGCHQSIAKLWPAQGGSTAGDTQYDPTLIPIGTGHGATWGRDWNGHIIGNSFLNSSHARFTGTIALNALGKYDLFDPSGNDNANQPKYSSIFQGFACWQSPSSSSPAKTTYNGVVGEITDKTTCETLYGAGSWRSTDSTAAATTQQGTCSTCHDVHQSLFVSGQEGIKKECQDCHANAAFAAAVPAAPQVVQANILHPTTAGTPFDVSLYGSPCVVCHMAQQQEDDDYNTLSIPAHVWRINTNPSYSTFPTMGEFYGGNCTVHSGAVQNAISVPVVYLTDLSSANCTAASGTWTAVTKNRNANVAAESYTKPDSTPGTYANAVWVDLDLACGQCHGGSAGTGNTANNAPYFDKVVLAGYAANIHNNQAVNPSFTVSYNGGNTMYASVNGSASTCNGGSCTVFDWNWGDGTAHGSGATATHLYTTGGEKTITLTVTLGSDSEFRAEAFNAIAACVAPVASGTLSNVGWTYSVADTSTAACGVDSVNITWGDGLTSTGCKATTCSHTYFNAGNYTITQTALSKGMSNLHTYAANASLQTISGTVKQSNGTTVVPSAQVTLKLSGVTKAIVTTNGSGVYTASNLKPGNYDIYVTKSGFTFNTPALSGVAAPSATANVTALTP